MSGQVVLRRIAAVVAPAVIAALIPLPASADHTVNPPPSSVTLSASKAVVEAGEPFTLTWTVDRRLELSISTLVLIDLTSGLSKGYWTSGSTGSATLSIGDAKPHTYEARVSHHGVLILRSEPVTVADAPWAVTISASLGIGYWVSVTATANQDVGKTSVLEILIENVATGTRLAHCYTTGLTCTVSDYVTDDESPVYRAYVSARNYYLRRV